MRNSRARFKRQVVGVVNATLIRGDGAAMPFPDARFDLITSNLGINNFPDPDAVLRECRRVLKRGGVLALTSNVEGFMAELYDLFARILAERGETEAETALHWHVAHRGTVTSIAERLRRAGLRVTRTEQREVPMRFADGSALLRHYFIRLGFLEGWRGLVISVLAAHYVFLKYTKLLVLQRTGRD